MASFREGLCALLLEAFVFFWCNTVRFLFWLRYALVTPRRAPPIKNELLLRSATRLAADIREGKLKSADLVGAYIRRIKEVQPLLNAVVEDVFEDALRKAEEVDRLVASGSRTVQQLELEQPLLGIPITTKNSVAVKGMRYDVGSPFSKGRRASQDAAVVAKLRAAGAIVVAMTNVPEQLLWFDAENKLDGATKNPYDTRRVPGGSSGGEACLIASGGSVLGIGTDIAGSIRLPSAYCGIFGHKPTAGVLSLDGLLPDVGTMVKYNTPGPMCRYAEDMPLMLSVMAGPKAAELRLDSQVLLRNLKVFYMEDEGSYLLSRVKWECRKAVRDVIDFVRNDHGVEVSRLEVPELRYGIPKWILAYQESKSRPLHDLFRPGSTGINYTAEFFRIMTGSCPNTAAAMLLCWASTFSCLSSERAIAAFRGTLDHLRDYLEALLRDDGVFILPATTALADYHHQGLFFPDGFNFTCVFNVLQVPVSVCPVLRTAGEGLPVAVQVVASRGNDRLCLAVAKEIERKFGGWVEPARAKQRLRG
uniref:Putative amidase n=1 Tax=Amblyomma triste TaxID=251400 RepID=A0A023GE29_AMBTT